MNFMTLDFFYTIRAFYAWVFPLNAIVTVSMVAGLAVGIFSRRKSRLRRVFGALRLVRGGGASLPLHRHGGALSLDQDPRTIKSHDIVVWRKAGRNGPEVSGPALSALLWKELFYGRK